MSADARWWQDAVIYHAYLPSIRDSDGDGLGDLGGLRLALPYLADELGVDAIWVSPFYASPWRDGGYDIADHCAVDPRYGTLQDVDALLADAHARGLRVIVDYVPNHTSDEHPWFVASRSSREDPRRDWYVWADPAPDGGPPSNWVSEAGGSTWEWDRGTGQYYLHSHLREQPDVNWRNPQLREAMLDVLRFWLDRGVDGVRVDVAHMLMKDPELRDNPLRPDGTPNPYDNQHPDFTTQWHVHDRRHPDLHEVLRAMRGVLDGYGDRIAIGEIEVMPWGDWATYFGADLDELHLPLNFKLIETPWDAATIADELTQLQRALPARAWPANNLGNHDRSRIASRWGPDAARAAALLLLTIRGTPILYYGDELGMSDVDVPRELQRDGFAEREGGPTRDPIRTPLPWDGGRWSSFAPPNAASTWLPIGPNAGAPVAAQGDDPGSMLSLYRALLALRREHPALRRGAIELLAGVPAGVLAYVRSDGSERLLVALNLGDAPARLEAPAGSRILLGTEAVADPASLGPQQGVVLRLAG